MAQRYKLFNFKIVYVPSEIIVRFGKPDATEK